MRLWSLGPWVLLFVAAAAVTGQPEPEQSEGPGIIGPTFVAVQVQDLALASAWYRSVFDLEQVNRIIAEDGRYSILVLVGEGIEVELLQVRGASGVDDPALGLFKVGFYVEDIESAHRWIRQQGGDTDDRIFTDEALQARSFVFRDPEGNRLQAFDRCAEPCR